MAGKEWSKYRQRLATRDQAVGKKAEAKSKYRPRSGQVAFKRSQEQAGSNTEVSRIRFRNTGTATNQTAMDY